MGLLRGAATWASGETRVLHHENIHVNVAINATSTSPEILTVGNRSNRFFFMMMYRLK